VSAIILWDAATGKPLRQIEANCWVWTLLFSADSQILYADPGSNTIRLFETASGKELALLAAHKSWVLTMAFSPNGKIVATGSKDQTIRLWDAATGKALGEIGPHPGGIARIAFSPDGKMLASVGGDTTVRLWDVANGRELKRFQGHKELVLSAAFSSDGKTLASGDINGVVQLWETTSGNVTTGLPAQGGDLHFLAFLPDKTLVTAFGDRRDTFPVARHDAAVPMVQLWDVAARKLRHCWKWPGEQVFSVALARDNKTLATGGAEDRIRTWDIAKRTERRSFVVRDGSTTRALAFSPDGRMLATGHDDYQVRLWEIATGQERRRLDGHQSAVYALAFSPDGKTLASGSHDTTVLLWDLHGATLPLKRPALSSRELEAAWAGLKNADAGSAFQSMGVLVRVPGQSVSLLKDHLHPVAPADPGTLKRLIADLDSDHFETRQKATAELIDLDTLAEEPVRKVLDGNPSPEARRRLDGLLRGLEDGVRSAEVLRALRALEVLEQVASPEAKQVLQDLAKGLPHARLTREAKATLERLGRRAK
jgi:WD40 repeat protein